MYKQGVRCAKRVRIIALLLAVILFIPLTQGWLLSASAAEPESNIIPESAFAIEGSVLVKIKSEEDYNEYNTSQYTKLIIPPGITEIASDAFGDMKYIEEVIIPDGVKSIGSNTFDSCIGLKSITIPGSVTSVGTWAFARCSSLESVTFLGSAKSNMAISDSAFEECNGLSKVYASHSAVLNNDCIVPMAGKTVTVYANASSSAGLYTKVGGTTEGATKTGFILEPLQGDSPAAYSYEVLSDNTVKVTGYYSDYKDAVIPATINGKTVTVVGADTLASKEGEETPKQNLDKVESVKIGKDVTTIEEGAFSGIQNKTPKAVVNVDENNEHLSGWVLDNQNGYDVDEVPKNLQKVIVSADPSDAVKAAPQEGTGVVEIDGVLQTSDKVDYVPYVFEASTDGHPVTTNIKTVPKLRTDGYPAYVFTHWELKAKNTSGGADTDISGEYIEDVRLPETVLTIPPVTYTDVRLIAHYEEVPDVEDSLVRKYDVSTGQHYICAYNGVVQGSTINPVLTINDSYPVNTSASGAENIVNKAVTQIGYTGEYNGVAYNGVVFKDKGLKTVRFGRGVQNVLPQAFDEAYGLQKIEVVDMHDTTGTIPAGSYYSRSVNGKEGTGVLFKKTAEGSELVAYPLGLKDESYSIPDDVTSIGERAFAGCTNIKSVTLNPNLRTIGDEAFKGCVNLGTVHMGASLESVGNSAFEGCGNLTNVIWGSSVKTIGNRAFYGTLLTVFELPSAVESIGERAFADCNHLQKITIYNRTVLFGEKVFEESGVNVSGTPTVTLAGYRDSTTKRYVEASAAPEYLVFEAIPGETSGGGETVQKYQVEVGSGATDWLWVSVDGGGHVSELTAEKDAEITVGVRKLEDSLGNGKRLLKNISITSEVPEDGGEQLDITKSATYMIITNQKEGLTLDDITYKFPMPAAHVTITVEDFEDIIFEPVPGGGESGPASLAP